MTCALRLYSFERKTAPLPASSSTMLLPTCPFAKASPFVLLLLHTFSHRLFSTLLKPGGISISHLSLHTPCTVEKMVTLCARDRLAFVHILRGQKKRSQRGTKKPNDQCLAPGTARRISDMLSVTFNCSNPFSEPSKRVKLVLRSLTQGILVSNGAQLLPLHRRKSSQRSLRLSAKPHVITKGRKQETATDFDFNLSPIRPVRVPPDSHAWTWPTAADPIPHCQLHQRVNLVRSFSPATDRLAWNVGGSPSTNNLFSANPSACDRAVYEAFYSPNWRVEAVKPVTTRHPSCSTVSTSASYHTAKEGLSETVSPQVDKDTEALSELHHSFSRKCAFSDTPPGAGAALIPTPTPIKRLEGFSSIRLKKVKTQRNLQSVRFDSAPSAMPSPPPTPSEPGISHSTLVHQAYTGFKYYEDYFEADLQSNVPSTFSHAFALRSLLEPAKMYIDEYRKRFEEEQ